LIINHFNVHTVGQKTQARRWAWNFGVCKGEDHARQTLFTAEAASGLRPSESEARFNDDFGLNWKTKVQSPFDNMLNIFFPDSDFKQCEATVTLLNINGQTVLKNHYDLNSSQVSLLVESLSAGIYILRIETDGEVQTHKVVKSE
jgi:hypothetical protein